MNTRIRSSFVSIAIIATATVLPFSGCTDTQQAQYNKAKAAITSALSSPQIKSLASAGEFIAQSALNAYAPAYAWTLPLALNTASGLLADKTTAESVATVQQTVAAVSGIPQYHDVASQIGNAIAAIAPANEEQRVAATQALALYISEHLPKPKSS